MSTSTLYHDLHSHSTKAARVCTCTSDREEGLYGLIILSHHGQGRHTHMARSRSGTSRSRIPPLLQLGRLEELEIRCRTGSVWENVSRQTSHGNSKRLGRMMSRFRVWDGLAPCCACSYDGIIPNLKRDNVKQDRERLCLSLCDPRRDGWTVMSRPEKL
ncbi:hypothetical protein J6590_033191 [Homalodisca vitripennis]|nr:hypothetical protein J6590_033191 [Homalodisca vitripennis]